MNNSIPYLVKKEDTLASIAKELGITNPNDLRHYHNMNAGIKDGIGPEPPSGKTLLTPSPEKIKEINAKRAEFDGAEKTATEKKEEEKQEQTKQQQEEKKQEEQKEKETAQSAHENKYFVVHGALCCCDKAENPKQTAKLLVTSHSKVVLNAEAGKFFATEVDKTFDPAAATFGKCTLKPSSGGNQPCALVPAPKWTKVFEKTQVFGNKVLTEISTLDCTIGGKIEVAKYGQTDTIMKEHAENTNSAALALINPAIKMPILETAYPSVSNITLKSLKDKPDFKPVSSTDSTSVKKVTIRQNDECNFLAKIKSGNVNLTSWVIYDGCTGDKDKRLFTEEQLGTSFKYTFPVLGKYRVEGYGKPKKEDFRGGIFNKNYPDCSIDIEVVVNKLDGAELVPIEGENFAKIIGGKMRLRQNFPASFKAKFLMTPTDQELENLKMYVTDALGNVLNSTKIRNAVSFIPLNTKAQYRIIAEYKLNSGEKLTQSFTGETISNSVSQITHDAAVIRPGTPMTFAVKASTFSLYIPDEKEAIAKEVRDVKWNLNGRLMGNGKSITLPGNEFMNLGKYVVEAYVTLANAYGKDAKHEDDDWHFEVKENDVITFSYNGIPKVGKTTQLVADQLVFPDLPANEMVVWDTTIPYNVIDKNTIAVTPLKAGKEIVKCRINRQPGKALSIDVKQAKVLGMLFTDSNGIEIEKSSWYQTVNIWVKQEHLIGEDLTVEIWDNVKGYCKVINVPKYDGNLVPLTLDSYIKGKAGDWAKLYVKIGAPKLELANPNYIFEAKNILDVEDKREIYSAQIGTQDAKQRHYHVDYNQVSYFYGKSRGIKAEEKLKITIYENGKKLFEVLPPDVKVDTSGVIQATLKWDIITQKLPSRAVYAVVQDAEGVILYNGAKTANGGVAVTKSSALLGLAEYKSAVLVKSSDDKYGNKSGTCVCKEYDLSWGNKFTCDERKKVVKICSTLWGESRKNVMANHLMNCMALETGASFKPDEGFSSGGATGLVQWTSDAINGMNRDNKYNKGIKLTKERLSKMAILEQLEYVELYFKMWMDYGKVINNSLDMYMCIWCPAAVGKDDSFVCYSEEKDKKRKILDPRATQPYDSNKSIDGEYYNEKSNSVLIGKQDKEIRKGELYPRLKVKEVTGLTFKVKIFDCIINDENATRIEKDGVLAKMKIMADEHHLYANETNNLRTDNTTEGLEKMDCSEFVSRYLFELGITKKPIYMTTANMVSESAFRRILGNTNIDLVKGSKEENFKPQRGDIFAWGSSKNGTWEGHTGVVYKYDEIKDTVTILESIGSSGSRDDSFNDANGGWPKKGCTRTAVYQRKGKALVNHSNWFGYYRPTNYTKKL